MPDVLEDVSKTERGKAFSFLMKNGKYHSSCTTVFPTMSASVDCSLLTGVYPDEHKVPGLVWYKRDSQEVINYMSGPMPVVSMGVEECAYQVLFEMNDVHLSKR
nr:alkaline phosphatase family protein [Brevibacillus laterosporus]